ncbi:zf-HC2 domain-containing protein [Streptomyces sp. NPDC050636]|uniref:zf-HC2 domain-containing protein n=1 Tax=Streptomyces sp. NPDC050636 TaxID=3154510 RepID=UPI00342E4ABB
MDPPDRKAVENHLAGCARCAAESVGVADLVVLSSSYLSRYWGDLSRAASGFC